LTPIQSVNRRFSDCQDKIQDKKNGVAEQVKIADKLEKLDTSQKLLSSFDAFIDEATWNVRFETTYARFLEMYLDPCIDLFFSEIKRNNGEPPNE